jgi:Stress responsive A/B Barrel Domain
MQLQNIFIHHVFFWLNNPESKEDLDALIEGLKKLSHANTIRQFHIGIPASTNRAVIETTYSISWFVLFDNKEDQDSYQVDSIHLNFVKECSHLWSKVIVYDTVDYQ